MLRLAHRRRADTNFPSRATRMSPPLGPIGPAVEAFVIWPEFSSDCGAEGATSDPVLFMAARPLRFIVNDGPVAGLVGFCSVAMF